jgi:hypothetical protein
MVERFGVITNCTARKRSIEPVARLQPSDLKGSAANIAARWFQTTAAIDSLTAVGDLYLGRAMVESKAVASQLDGSLHVISAGLGLKAQNERVPNYDITVASGPGSLFPALARAGSTAADWWQELNAIRGSPMPLSHLINLRGETRFLLALPSAYVDMLSHDLERIKDDALDRLYIFTSNSGSKLVSDRLVRCILTYDERLEGHPGYAGTRSDFPQRAMRHFVEQLQGHRLTHTSAQDAVQACLHSLKRPLIPHRERKSDSEILELLRVQWTNHAGSSSRLLRYLRDTALVACEQSRFGGLWRQVKAETR